MPKIEDFKFYKFVVDGKNYVLKSTERYSGLAASFGMTPVTATNGIVPASEGETLSAETAIKRGLMVPMIVNFRGLANTKKRGRATIGVPLDMINKLDTVTATAYGAEYLITSVKFSVKRDFR